MLEHGPTKSPASSAERISTFLRMIEIFVWFSSTFVNVAVPYSSSPPFGFIEMVIVVAETDGATVGALDGGAVGADTAEF